MSVGRQHRAIGKLHAAHFGRDDLHRSTRVGRGLFNLLDDSATKSGGADKATSGLKECQQVGVELVFVSVREAVGCARVDL